MLDAANRGNAEADAVSHFDREQAAEDFRGAFKKTVTPYISIRAENVRPVPTAIDDPY